jgi:hypothetical protein
MIIRGYEINNRNEKHKSRKMILDLCHPTRRVKQSRGFTGFWIASSYADRNDEI